MSTLPSSLSTGDTLTIPDGRFSRFAGLRGVVVSILPDGDACLYVPSRETFLRLTPDEILST